jgi:hypothetical protein
MHAQYPSVARYVIPEPAHIVLVKMRDHLRFMSYLVRDTITATGTPSNPLTPEALSWCFSHMAQDLDDIVDTTYWLAPPKESRKDS